MLIVVIAASLIICLSLFIWTIKISLSKCCPICKEEGEEEMVLPILPGFKWWCIECNSVIDQADLAEGGAENNKTNETYNDESGYEDAVSNEREKSENMPPPVF